MPTTLDALPTIVEKALGHPVILPPRGTLWQRFKAAIAIHFCACAACTYALGPRTTRPPRYRLDPPAPHGGVFGGDF